MRYEPLPSSFFAGNREELASRLPAGSMLILHANDVFPTNADGTFALHQNANLFYLTGVDQEETVLVMTIREGGWDEILLLRETNEQIAIWEGARLSQEQARELSGIQDVRWTDEYDALLEALVPSASMVFVEANQHPRCTCPVETRNARMTKELKEKFPDAVLKNVYEIMADMRQIKKPEEIKALKKACDITNEGFRELLRFIRPGVGEWQIEGFLANEFISRGPRKFSFLPIIASGKDTCVLHYIQNDKRCEDGDLVLMDIGTEYGNYNSDMTRTVPVNGKFTPRQRAVYESVLNMMTYAKKILRPGILKSEYERLVRVFAAGELVKLGLITPSQVAEKPSDPPIVRKYYMHGCSHFLGLDVHDVGEANPVVLPGMVFTVEPGIYIPDKFGVRIEDLAIITEFGGVATIHDTKKKREIIVTNNETGESKAYLIPYGSRIKVQDGAVLGAGDELTEGSVNPHDILKIKGLRAVQDYMIQEVQRVYRLQGVEINDKHIEVIVRQMLKKIRIEEKGDTEFLPGTMVNVLEFDDVNEKMIAEGKEPATGVQVMLGITKASLATDSFLSAASFQETTKVLTEAAIKGKVDHLIGVKENVLIGKLIPAGTGMRKYRDVKLDTDMAMEDEISLEDFETFTLSEESVAELEAQDVLVEDLFNSIEE